MRFDVLPECANRRSRPLIRKLKGMVNRPGRSYWFLTLTVPNTENLSRQDISAISDQFGGAVNSWVFQEVEDETEKRFGSYGGVRSIECVYEPESESCIRIFTFSLKLRAGCRGGG